jgi:Uma2 family endonuclease
MTTETDLELESEEFEDEKMGTFEHSVICINIITELSFFLKGKNFGRVADSSAEYRFLDKPEPTRKGRKSARQPDISFVKQENLPKRFRSYPEIAPDLAIEVTSPGDKDYEIEAKIAEYQKAGVSLIWIIHPISRRVDVYRLENRLRPQIYMGDDELNGEGIIPGFKLMVSAIFDYPYDPDPEPELPGENSDSSLKS